MMKKVHEWERQLSSKVKNVRTDEGTEYNDFNRWCEEVGIQREKSVVYTPQQNGRAERFNRTIQDRGRALLIESGMPNQYWADALVEAAKLYNIAPRKKETKSPYELFYGVKPNVSSFRTFGCKVYSKIPKTERKGKLGERSETGRLLGEAPGTKGWRILLDDGRIVIRCDVVFEENIRCKVNDDDDATEDPLPFIDLPSAAGKNMEETAEGNNDDEQADHDQHDIILEEDPEVDLDRSKRERDWPSQSEVNDLPEERYSARASTRAPSKRFKDSYLLTADTTDGLSDEPEFDEAMSRPDAELWLQACEEEMNSLRALGVYKLIDKPEDRRLLKCKWVFKRKRNPDGLIERYKARLVAKGFTQKKGIDYDEVFAPVARHATLRMLLGVVAVEDLELVQIDVKTAFLNGPLQEELYMDTPRGYDFQGKVMKLEKSLYGLKQAARAWNLELIRVLTAHGLRMVHADASLFVMEHEGRRAYLLIYVDDGLVAGKQEDVDYIIKGLQDKFDLRFMGEGTKLHFLSMSIERDRTTRTICLSQAKYAHEVLQRTNMTDCKPKSIPMEVNAKLSKEGGKPMANPGIYAETVGMLMYLATGTRPDISFAVGQLARFMANPRQDHWLRVKWLLQYLKGTSDMYLKYGGDSGRNSEDTRELIGFCDANYAADPDTRKSTGGYVFKWAGAAISWASKMHQTVATSTLEAEYMTSAWATKEGLWLRKLLTAFTHKPQGEVVRLKCDNQGALALMRNPVCNQRAKHIDVSHHFVRERVIRGEIKVEYCATEEMEADILTKALSKGVHEKFSKNIGLRSFKKIGNKE